MIILSTCGAALCGFSLASHPTRWMRLHKVIYTIAMAASFFTIIDLEYPRWGLIQLVHPINVAYDQLALRMGL